MRLRKRHLLDIASLEPEEIRLILDSAESFAEIGEREIKKVPTLRGQTVINFFVEPSTRTRSSFELAEKRLSADSISFSASTSSFVKGETLLDTARNLEAMAPDFIVIRHSEAGAPHFLARHCNCSIINAGDGAHEHPTQALLDAYTIRRRRELEGLRVSIIGDILHSRVARSNILLLSKMGAEVTVCGPPTLLPPDLDRLGCKVTFRLAEAVEGAQVVMALRIQLERMSGGFFPSLREYASLYGVTAGRLESADPEVLVMHPGPMNRGVEITGEVADGERSVILEQVTNGVAVRMAVLYLLAGDPKVKLLLSGGRVVDPASETDAALDVLIEDGRIARIDRGIQASDAECLDVSGMSVCPGFLDMHVHLREPGQEWKETVATGTRAAARGGFTAVACMPNTVPVNDSRSVTELIVRQARDHGLVRVYPIGCVTKQQEGRELAEMEDMSAAGACAFSDDGMPVVSTRMMRRALEYSKIFDVPIIDHCEDPDLVDGGVMNEGTVSTALGLPGWPTAAEDVMIQRDILLAEDTGGHAHIAHMSTARGAESVRLAKRRNIPVTCEVTPHHLVLTDEAVGEYDTAAKMNPPLRAERDRQGLLEALADGTVDAIATDHAPHHVDEKRVEFCRAPFGVIGLETAVSLCMDRLVHAEVIGFSRLVELFTINPARILRKDGGRLAVGAEADITVIDRERRVTVRAEEFASKSRNMPFEGWDLRGAAVMTIVSGKVVHDARQQD